VKLDLGLLLERLDLIETTIEGRMSGIEGRIADLYSAIEGRMSGIEGRIADLYSAIEIRHVDMWKLVEERHSEMWKLVEERHSEMWKLITDVNNSLPMTVAVSISESSRKLADDIRSDIADTRQEISSAVSKIVITNE
jgi:hypothetical protein